MKWLEKRVVISVVVVVFTTTVFLKTSSAGHDEGVPGQIRALAAQVEALEEAVGLQQKQIAELKGANAGLAAKLQCVSNTSTGQDIIFEGCNVHVLNGAGRTDTTNGFGNLIVGYNKNEVSTRTGSHNFVVGDLHEYTSYGGVVSGTENTLSAPNATVLSSTDSAARNLSATILSADRGIADTIAVIAGGSQNYAGPGANFGAVIGGHQNSVNGSASVSVGGALNNAAGSDGVTAGGSENQTTGTQSTVCGGEQNVSSGLGSSISGGLENVASGRASSVSGGSNNTASGDFSSVLGGTGIALSTPNGTSP
jgi:hypothetical protein